MNKSSLCLLFLLLSTIAHPATGQSLWNIQPEAVDYATVGIKPSEFDSTEPGRSEIIARIKMLMQEEPALKYPRPKGAYNTGRTATSRVF